MSADARGGELHVSEPVSSLHVTHAPEVDVDVTWELSKENVLPLARGRKPEAIKRAFGPVSAPLSASGDEAAVERASQEVGELQGGAGTGSSEVLSALKR